MPGNDIWNEITFLLEQHHKSREEQGLENEKKPRNIWTVWKLSPAARDKLSKSIKKTQVKTDIWI